MLKMFYLCGFFRCTVNLMGYRKIIRSLIRFLSLYLNEFLQSEMKQKLSSVQKITFITAIADKNNNSIL